MLLRWLLTAVSLLIVAHLFPGLLKVKGVVAALVASLAIGLINAVVKPIVIFLTLPLTLLTFGLFLLVINALMLLMASWLVPGFEVQGFWGALIGSLLISLVSWLLSVFIGGMTGRRS